LEPQGPFRPAGTFQVRIYPGSGGRPFHRKVRSSAANAAIAIPVLNSKAKAARCAPLDGRPVFAANRALEWPTEPLARLWHAVTLLREHRGDGHVAVLASLGVSGRESNVLHAAAGRVPQAMIMRGRDYDDEQWAHYRGRLAGRGLLDGDGALTDAGRELKRRIEHTTDKLALSALEALDDGEVEKLFLALTPITRKVVAAGDVPDDTPMGLRRDDLHDASAHLS